MKIELKKKIKINKMIFVGELDFFEKSPYIELLKDIKTEDDLKNLLEDRKMPQSAINNLLKRLKDLKVLHNGEIKNLTNGFPSREYGKYTLETFENDNMLPFQFKNRDIKRDTAFDDRIDNLRQDINFMDMVKDESNKKFRIEKIENNKVNRRRYKDIELKLFYKKDSWSYELDNKNYPMDSINFDKIFDGLFTWSEEYEAVEVSFDDIKDDNEVIKSFLMDLDGEIELEFYGEFEAYLSDIPIIPKSEKDAKQWLYYLIKDDIEQKDNYLFEDQVQEIFYNYSTNNIFARFEFEYDYDEILKQFDRKSKAYWLIEATKDLYPFDYNIPPKKRVLIENGDFENTFGVIGNLVIIDRYINTTRHFDILKDILEKVANPNSTIYTTDIYKQDEKNRIETIINELGINRIVKEKNELPHARYWIIDNNIYKVSESLDGINNTSFDLYAIDNIKKIEEESVYNMIKGAING